MILHFSGHGVTKSENETGEDSLIIENDNLSSEYFTESKIAEMLVDKNK
jgi:hypothetical protein